MHAKGHCRQEYSWPKEGLWVSCADEEAAWLGLGQQSNVVGPQCGSVSKYGMILDGVVIMFVAFCIVLVWACVICVCCPG